MNTPEERYDPFAVLATVRGWEELRGYTMTQLDTDSADADDEAAWLRDQLQAAGVDPAAIDEAVEAHRKGVLALLRWEDNDFDLGAAVNRRASRTLGVVQVQLVLDPVKPGGVFIGVSGNRDSKGRYPASAAHRYSRFRATVAVMWAASSSASGLCRRHETNIIDRARKLGWQG